MNSTNSNDISNYLESLTECLAPRIYLFVYFACLLVSMSLDLKVAYDDLRLFRKEIKNKRIGANIDSLTDYCCSCPTAMAATVFLASFGVALYVAIARKGGYLGYFLTAIPPILSTLTSQMSVELIKKRLDSNAALSTGPSAH